MVWDPRLCPSQPRLMHGALLQVAGLRGLILRSQLIVLLKHKVGDAAWRPFELCLTAGAPVPLLPQAPCCLPCSGGAGGGSLSSPSAHPRRWWGLPCCAGVTPASSCTSLGSQTLSEWETGCSSADGPSAPCSCPLPSLPLVPVPVGAAGWSLMVSFLPRFLWKGPT